MTLTLNPDAELVTRTYLTTITELVDLVGTDANGEARIYTVIPKPPPTGPFLRLRRLPSAPVRPQRRWLDAAAIQIEGYGGSKRTANIVTETALAALELMHLAEHEGAVVAVAEFGPMGYLPDPDLLTERSGARERYVADVTIVLHPARD